MQSKHSDKSVNELTKSRVYTLIRVNDKMGDAEGMNYFELIITNVTETVVKHSSFYRRKTTQMINGLYIYGNITSVMSRSM